MGVIEIVENKTQFDGYLPAENNFLRRISIMKWKVKFKLEKELIMELDEDQTKDDLQKEIEWWIENEYGFCEGLLDGIEFEIE